ncbi:SulP family inorganic anion transporter [Hansschlegelia zhihuaiae]|uniref:SulP family inorganic anion transporter n=1 Tax=Hansschlegelia zhihuaiae TaxID=405005 RepID=A0A4Q0M9U0_9HYPH|nr:SulP family inorganic anion transporter [Hansschlegelia zhihuaiae]RXF69855.1 SulP family inorganic anion transporter [Hansschlegelia zhihuaiae]
MRLLQIARLRTYRPEWLRYDVTAGLAIAAVGLPSAIAYPALAGLPPEVGLYASIVSVLGYALLGSSKQLVVGPDAGTVTVLAAVLLSFGPATAEERVVASAALAAIAGALYFVAYFLRLGFIANFLSRPILTGFMTGVSLSILIGQLGRFTGIKIDSDGLIRPLIELAGKAADIHWPSVALGSGLFVLLRLLSAWRPAIPGPLIAVALAILLSAVFDFSAMGIRVVGEVPSKLPFPALPIPRGVAIDDLILGAVALLIVSFGSGIVTARSFGAKNRHAVDANRELLGFGGANLASGLFGGFAVTASDSRTAINDLMGGKTQLAAIVSAVALAVAVLFLTKPLSILPTPALGAILASAAVSLLNLRILRDLWRVSRIEFVFAFISIAGVITLGVLKGVVVAIAATLLYLVMKGLRPHDAMLGRIPGREGFYKLHRHPDARPIAGLAIYLVQGSLLFFNADYVRSRVEAAIATLPPETRWFILDASAAAQIDTTAATMLDELCAFARRRGLKFGVVQLHGEPLDLLRRSGVAERIGTDMIFEDAEDAVVAFHTTSDAGESPQTSAPGREAS